MSDREHAITALRALLWARCHNCGHALRDHPVRVTDLYCVRFTGFEHQTPNELPLIAAREALAILDEG